MEDAWVLQLKDESKDGLTGAWYYADNNEFGDFITQDLNDATIFKNKEKAIREMKAHEAVIKKEFGDDAVCNAGYTNMMQHFKWIEVELHERN
ncbi:hypothetical protein [Neobacillus mesonae]|uniref:hypothetical protein n=1 Tax=Neobacillus mesonae TaxID=1193713 RepID=UPI00203FA771|nr:hypothetical protein [Neobacillus mesonae]MCM3567876.1 hypothetical protein [Neobacillus mesonae]